MLSIIISFFVSVLIIYALYNALGYYEEYKKDSNLKDIENLLDKTKKSILKDEEDGEESDEKKDFMIRNNENETALIRALDQDSQNKLLQINSNSSYGFHLSEFQNFCEKNYTKLLKLIHEKKINEIQAFTNDPTFQKISKIPSKKIEDLNLFKIHEIKILKIDIQENFLIVTVEILSEEMIKDDEKSNHFSNQKFKRILDYGHDLGALDSPEDSKNWIILRIEAEDF